MNLKRLALVLASVSLMALTSSHANADPKDDKDRKEARKDAREDRKDLKEDRKDAK